ncbi:DUF1640 domain-containing protein [Candidatus Regiella insecticola]|uniref:Hypothetical phage protein n=1 Tax=Candidatus Regiella insecticola TaxID=138073 RepID=A0A6L2ZRQ1_9ENTR|nr:DUF1640 domain-containing protein [Candidatus Regiella insecticola]GFN47466.1 hypothetical phage protein [Candidatus Regiella insecticola]
MAQVAFDTQEFVETLENAGFRTEQAKALSLAVRKSHEVADVATKRDLEDLRKDLTIHITDSHRNLSAEIVGIRKDMEARFEKTDAQIADVRKDFMTEMSLMRKDIEKSGMQTTIKLGGMLVVAVGVILAVLKIPF